MAAASEGVGDAMTSWEELKDLGNAAFKAKEFEKAVEHFTDAIELSADSHVLYSNRSGAYASLMRWQEALADADKCISLKPDWAKGYGRRGAAYEGLGQPAKAKEAYEAGLVHDPQSATLKAALSNVTPRRATAGMPPPGFPFGYAPPPVVVLTGPALLLNYAVVACSIFYILPLFGSRISFYAYRLALLSCVLKYGRELHSKFGLSRALLSKWGEIKKSDSAHYFALSFALLLWRPIPFIIMPMATNAVGGMVPALIEQVKDLPQFVQKRIRERIEWMGSDEGRMLFAAFASTSEVMVSFGLLLSCFASVRNVGMLLFYLNFLSWRHAASPMTQQAVWVLRSKMDEWCHHKWAPKLLGVIYEKGKMMLSAYMAPKPEVPKPSPKEEKAS